MARRAKSLSHPRRRRFAGLAGAGVALTALALWLRLDWAPEHVGSPAEIAADYVRLGSQAAVAGRFTQAVGFYSDAVQLDPRNVDAWICLGSARADAEDRRGALLALEEARRLAPDQPDVDRALARVQLRFRDFAEARRAAERALRHSPADPLTVVLLGLARAEALASPEDEAAVEGLMRRALALGYRGPEPHYGLGLVALRRRRPLEAVEAFRAAVQRDPGSRAMQYRLASAYRLAGRPREAERALEQFQRLTQSPAEHASAPPSSQADP